MDYFNIYLQLLQQKITFLMQPNQIVLTFAKSRHYFESSRKGIAYCDVSLKLVFF